MKTIGDLIEQNPILSIFVVAYIVFFAWIVFEFYTAPTIDDKQ